MPRGQSYEDFVFEHLEALMIDSLETNYDPTLAREAVVSTAFRRAVRQTKSVLLKQTERVVLEVLRDRRRRETGFH